MEGKCISQLNSIFPDFIRLFVLALAHSGNMIEKHWVPTVSRITAILFDFYHPPQ